MHRSILRLLVGGLILIIGCLGCSSNKAATGATAAPKLKNTGAPPTVAECEELGKKLEEALRKRDTAYANNFYRFKEVLLRSFSDIDMPDNMRKGIDAQVSTAIGPAMQNFNDQLSKAKVKFLRVKTVDGQNRIVMRLIMDEDSGGCNYHEYPVVRYPDGQLGAEDMYSMVTGEMITTTVRRLLVPMITQSNQGLLDRLTGGEQLYAKNMSKIMQMTSQMRQRNMKAVLASYESLPAELQKDKSLLIIAIQCASDADEKKYETLIGQYRSLFPNDNAIDMLSIDFFVLKKQYDQALGCCDRMIKSMGDDGYLHVLKANIYSEAGKKEEMFKQLEQAVAVEKDLDDAYWTCVTSYLKTKENDKALIWLKKVVENCGATLELDSLPTIEVYKDFAKSKEFKELREWYQTRNKAEKPGNSKPSPGKK